MLPTALLPASPVASHADACDRHPDIHRQDSSAFSPKGIYLDNSMHQFLIRVRKDSRKASLHSLGELPACLSGRQVVSATTHYLPRPIHHSLPIAIGITTHS